MSDWASPSLEKQRNTWLHRLEELWEWNIKMAGDATNEGNAIKAAGEARKVAMDALGEIRRLLETAEIEELRKLKTEIEEAIAKAHGSSTGHMGAPEATPGSTAPH